MPSIFLRRSESGPSTPFVLSRASQPLFPGSDYALARLGCAYPRESPWSPAASAGKAVEGPIHDAVGVQHRTWIFCFRINLVCGGDDLPGSRVASNASVDFTRTRPCCRHLRMEKVWSW